MGERHTVLRSVHDLGLAAWFGGSSMGAVGLNGAAAKVSEPRQRLGVSSAGWDRWAPANAAAIGAHLVGAAGLFMKESPRVVGQAGVGRMSAVKTGLTLAALAATGYSRLLGRQLEKAADGTPVSGATEPEERTDPAVASRQRRLKVVQWAIPAITGAMIVVTAWAGEQQKPGQVGRGVLGRLGGMAGASRATRKLSSVRIAQRAMARKRG